MKIIYDNTWEDLTVKMLGYYHDHCQHFYSGATDEVPDKYKSLITEDKKYCFIYKDIGSGLNYKRPSFIKLIKNIINSEIQEIIVAHKDRLVRFGFELIEWLCDEYNVELTVINDERMSPSEEMTKDLMSIIHVFSSRFYGLRKYKNNIINDICKETQNIPK